MKKIALLLLLLLTSLNSFCQNASARTKEKQIEINEKNLSKKWLFYDMINNKTKEENAESKALMEGTSLTFREDKTFTFEFVMPIDGTWVLDSAEKIITTKDRRGTDTWTIHALSANELIASRNDAGQKIIFRAQ